MIECNVNMDNYLVFIIVLHILVAASHNRPRCVNLRSFCSYYEVQEYLFYLKDKYPERVELEDLGVTYYGHKITLVKILSNQSLAVNSSHETTENKTNDKTQHLGIWVDSLIHAREWVTLPVTLLLLNQLVEKADSHRDMLRYFDWYILPIVNPTGYEHSRNVNRMWRKNIARRSKYCRCSECGVDLNRNFDVAFSIGTLEQCSATYRGPRAESEPETKAVSAKLRELKSRLIMYFALHSAKSAYYIPWASKYYMCEDYRELTAMGEAMIKTVQKVTGEKFSLENYGSSESLAGGSASDYAKSLGIKYSYTVELPCPRNPDAPSIFHVEAVIDSKLTATGQFLAFRTATSRLKGIYIDHTIFPKNEGVKYKQANRSLVPLIAMLGQLLIL